MEIEVDGGSGGEDGGGDLPDGVRMLELDQPLVGGHPVARLRVMVQHVDSTSNLRAQLLHHTAN